MTTRERGFRDSIIEIAMETCIHRLLAPRDSRDEQSSADKFIYKRYIKNN